MYARRVAAGAVVGITLALMSAGARADVIPYPDVGTQNPIVYTFTATSTGDLSAYYYGSGGAVFDEQLGVLINGTPSVNGTGLDNHSTALGTVFDFGPVTAGDVLTFYINVQSFTGDFTYYSNPGMNAGDENHIYSTAFSGGTINGVSVPAGTYVGFEDESPANGETSDWNYQDEQFVFTNTSTAITGVPEPATVAMLLTGLGMLGIVRRRSSR